MLKPYSLHFSDLKILPIYVGRKGAFGELLKAYVIAETDEENLFIHNVFADSQIELDEIISSFGDGIKNVTLGFVPKDVSGYEVKELKEDDTTLFVSGFSLENKKLMFPTLSHA